MNSTGMNLNTTKKGTDVLPKSTAPFHQNISIFCQKHKHLFAKTWACFTQNISTFFYKQQLVTNFSNNI